MRRLFWGVLAVFFCLFILGPIKSNSTAQDTKQGAKLQYEVQVTLKLVQVYVTDKKGNPILDLTKDDFLIYDEGKQQKITEFEKHVLVQKEEAQPQVPDTPAQQLLPRKFFLFFDFAFNNGIGLEKARKAAIHFIDNELQPADEVSLLSYSAVKSLKLHEYLTTDHKKVRAVVKRIGMEAISGRAENFEAQYWQAQAGAHPAAG